MKSLITCLVAGAGYLIHPQKLGSIQETINPDSIIPVTLLTTDEIFGDLEAQLHLFDIVDDVFIPEFGSVLVEKPGGNDSVSSFLAETLGSRQLYRLSDVQALEDVADLPSGPYFLHGPNLHQAWKLYDDTSEAFTVGVIPEDVNKPDSFRALTSLSTNGAAKAIPVPSRLYYPPPLSEQPLSGVRISVTESLSLNGIYTTLSSRAWSSLQISPAHSTNTLVRALLRMGAVIVGKTKTSQFDAGGDWVDSSAPWNPRADGYQTSGGTSAGVSAALASYDWLQYSIGRDGIDGVRGSAALQGLFSLRPSTSALTHDRADSSLSYETIGFTSRDIDLLFDLADKTLDLAMYEGSLPQNLIYPVDFFSNLPETEDIVQKQFITTIENFLGIKAEPLTIADVWKRNPPPEAEEQGMQEYLDKAPYLSFCYDLYHHYDTFRDDYREAFGHAPYAESSIQFQWHVGQNVSEADYADYNERVDVFRKWFDENIMSLQKSPNTVMLLPWYPRAPAYRDELRLPPAITRGITPELLSPILQTPHLTVPFAQIPYESRISTRPEQRPVSGSLMGPKGGDLMLIQTVKQAFELAAWRTWVDTGRLTFPVGDNSRNVDDQHVREAFMTLPSARYAAQKPPVINEL